MGIAVLLAATLALAGVAKLRDPSGLAQAVAAFAGPARARPLVRALAVVECVLAVLLLAAPTRTAAAAATVLLMLGFTGALGVLRRRSAASASGPIACNCFGSSSDTSLGLGQVRNVLLAAAGVVLVLAPVDGAVGGEGLAGIVLALCLASGAAAVWQLTLTLSRLTSVAA